MRSGKPSVTHYEVIEAFRHASLVDIHLETGRTQIRVHLAAIKHPCCSDPLYGADPALARKLSLDRQWRLPLDSDSSTPARCLRPFRERVPGGPPAGPPAPSPPL